MRDALNKTGRNMWYAIHAGNCEDWSQPVTCVNGSVANMWRTGGDLSASTFDMWTNREYCKRCLLAQALRHLFVCFRTFMNSAGDRAQAWTWQLYQRSALWLARVLFPTQIFSKSVIVLEHTKAATHRCDVSRPEKESDYKS
jgi:hypothetical protein